MPAMAAVSRWRPSTGRPASSERIWPAERPSSLVKTARPAPVRLMTWRRASAGERVLATSPSASNRVSRRLRYPASMSSQRRRWLTSISSARASSKMTLASVREYGMSSSPSLSRPSTFV